MPTGRAGFVKLLARFSTPKPIEASTSLFGDGVQRFVFRWKSLGLRRSGSIILIDGHAARGEVSIRAKPRDIAENASYVAVFAQQKAVSFS
ncbi:MAG: hypothetical protein ABI082_12665 [Dokdonella sp.]